MKYYLITFVLGVALGLFVSFMYCTILSEVPKSIASTINTNDLKEEVAKSELNYTKAVDSLKMQSSKLKSELSSTKTELSKAKQKNYSLQVSVYDLIDKHSEKQTLGIIEADNNCDSLIDTVEDLMQSSSEKDSLYEKATVNLEGQVKNKDSTITFKEKQYEEIKSAFAISINNSDLLSKENKQLTGQVKRQKFKSKVLSAALLILTGAAVNFFIQH